MSLWCKWHIGHSIRRRRDLKQIEVFLIAFCVIVWLRGQQNYLLASVLSLVIRFINQLIWWEPWGGYMLLLVYGGWLFILLTYIISFTAMRRYPFGQWVLLVWALSGEIWRNLSTPGVELSKNVLVTVEGLPALTLLVFLSWGLLFLSLSLSPIKAARATS